MMPLLELYRGNSHDAAYQGGVQLAVIARLYDWGFPHLSVDQRQDLIDWMDGRHRGVPARGEWGRAPLYAE
jgi:hypothetical protein